MASTTVNPEEARLLAWVKDTDERSQDAEERISALTLAIKALVKGEVWPAERIAISRLCDDIAGASHDLMNHINSDAEEFGANFSEGASDD